MLHIFFGARLGTDYHVRLTDIYDKIWDSQWHFYTDDDQVAAYQELRDTLLEQVDAQRDSPDMSGSIMGRIRKAEALDETILANMIYMVETGRFAVYSLMRWSSKYAIDYPEAFTRIGTDPNSMGKEQDCPAQAFVQETLRLNQTERLLRHVRESFVFEGKLFPKGSIARLCLWESHKDEELFPSPFEFNPKGLLIANSPWMNLHPLEWVVTAVRWERYPSRLPVSISFPWPSTISWKALKTVHPSEESPTTNQPRNFAFD